VQQAHQLGITAKLYASVLPASADSRSALKTLDNGVVFANVPLLDELLTKQGQEIYAKYRSKYGEPRSVAVLALLAIASVRIFDEWEQSKLAASSYCKDVHFHGLLGELSFDADGAVQGLSYEVQTIKDGLVVKLKE